MVNGQKRRKRRRPRKGSKARRQSSQNPFIVQAIGAIILIVLVIFLVPLGIIPDTNIAIAICMLILGGMFYLMFVSNPKPRKRRRKKAKKSNSNTEPQFYTALPSTLGLTDIPEQVPTPQVKLPPRPIRAARRRRDFVTYPLSVGGGAYSDSYVQVDKDTVLRLRSEMAPELQSIKLGGPRISSFPSAREASVMSKEASPVAAEPVVAEASPVAAETMGAETTVPVEAGIAQTATPIQSTAADEEEEELEFDMEWD